MFIISTACTPLTVMQSKKTQEPVNSLETINVAYVGVNKESLMDIKNPNLRFLSELESAKLGKGILNTIPEFFNQHNIKSVAIANQENKEINRESLVALASPEQAHYDVLVIKPLQMNTTCYGNCSYQFTVMTNLFDPQLNQSVWEAVISLPEPATAFSSYESVAEKLANSVLEKLKADGVLK